MRATAMVARVVFFLVTSNSSAPDARSAAGSDTPQMPSNLWAVADGVGWRRGLPAAKVSVGWISGASRS